MASNPSTNIQTSQPTIYETAVGEMQARPPPMPTQSQEPKVPNYKTQAAPVERNPFLAVVPKIVPPKDSTQESLNAWGRAGYLRNILAVDQRVREHEILQQSSDFKLNSIVNDEFERRRAVLRGTQEATGMTPAEIDEKFAMAALKQSPEAVARASSDTQVRDALIRYFTLRGGVVPAYLTNPPPEASSVNTAMGTTPAMAEGLEMNDADQVEQRDFKPEWEEETATDIGGGGTIGTGDPSMGMGGGDRRAARGETIPSSPKNLDEIEIYQMVEAVLNDDEATLRRMGKDALIRFAAAHGQIRGERRGEFLTMKTARNRYNMPELVQLVKDAVEENYPDGQEQPEGLDLADEKRDADGSGMPSGTSSSAVLPTNGVDAPRK